MAGAGKHEQEIVVLVEVGDASIRQTVYVMDLGFETATPLSGTTTFSFRRFRPDQSILAHLVRDQIDRFRAGDADAGGELAWQLLGDLLGEVLTERRFSLRELRYADVKFNGAKASQHSLERSARSAVSVAKEDIETRLVAAVLGIDDISIARTLWPDVTARANQLWSELVPEVMKMHKKLKDATNHARVREAERRRLLQFIRRRLDADRDDGVVKSLRRKLLALRCASRGDELVDRANRLTLAALAGQMTAPERRAFKFYYLKRRTPVRPVEDGLWFDGIINYQPFLKVLLYAAPTIHQDLALSAFFRAWPPDQAEAAAAMVRCALEGLLWVGLQALENLRISDMESKTPGSTVDVDDIRAAVVEDGDTTVMTDGEWEDNDLDERPTTDW